MESIDWLWVLRLDLGGHSLAKCLVKFGRTKLVNKNWLATALIFKAFWSRYAVHNSPFERCIINGKK